MSNGDRRSTIASCTKELSPAEAEDVRAKCIAAYERITRYANSNPQEATEMLAQMGLTTDQLARNAANLATFRLREHARANPNPAVVISRDLLRQIGMHGWAESFQHVDPRDIQGAISAMVAAAEARGDRGGALMLSTEEGAMVRILTARWAHYGFPAVQLGHTYAAALMSTGIASGEILPPWETFIIDLPTGMLHTTDGAGVRRPLVMLVVARFPSATMLDVRTLSYRINDEELWSISALTACGVEVHRYRQPLELMRKSGEEEQHLGGAFDAALTDEDDRVLALLTRLALNVCVAMSDPESVKSVGRHGTSVGSTGRRAAEPTSRVFSVGRPIDVDCRQEVADYLAGTKRGGPLTVQFMVRGHWRHQAHGPKMTERRLMWMQPYWKGAEDGPIVVRPHIVGTGAQAGDA